MLLIDGHNLIGKLPNISLGDPDDEARLMRVLENYHATRPHEPILVMFDPARHGSGGFSDLRGQTQFVRAVFARRNENADDVIARIVQSAKNPRSIVVVTSDNAVQRAVRRHGAKTIPSEEFAAALEAAMRPPKPKAELVPPPEEREKPQDSDVTYWLRYFKEPPPAPPKPASAPARRRAVAKNPPTQSGSTSGGKPGAPDDLDEWLRLFGEPRLPRDEKHLPPSEAPRRASSVEDGDSKPADEVDSVEYWLREMNKKRDADDS